MLVKPNFMSMFITGASQTMIPIIGVCLGEKDYDGVRYAFRRAARVLAVSSVVIMLFICIEPEPIIKFFGITSPTDIANTVPAMRINALSFPGLSFSFCCFTTIWQRRKELFLLQFQSSTESSYSFRQL